MKYIANIVTTTKIEVSSYFNVTNDYDSINPELPTLIIGWNNVKQLFENQNILDNKISNNIYWTFSKREKRYKYEKDLEDFISLVLLNLDKTINYKFFNFILATREKQEGFIRYINKGNSSIYYNSRFLYVYNPTDKITFGISLKDLSYIGICTKDFINTLNINHNNLICNDLKCIDDNSYFLIKDNVKNIAYLNYLRN